MDIESLTMKTVGGEKSVVAYANDSLFKGYCSSAAVLKRINLHRSINTNTLRKFLKFFKHKKIGIPMY
jgi:hypothetical protein